MPSQENEHPLLEDVTATTSQVRERSVPAPRTPVLEQEKQEYQQYPPGMLIDEFHVYRIIGILTTVMYSPPSPSSHHQQT